MQAAIDNSKRKYAVSIPDEIARIKKELDVVNNRYPIFWGVIRRKQGFNLSKINPRLDCPMNRLNELKVCRYNKRDTIPTSEFFVPHKLDGDRRKSKKVENLIEKYSLKLFNARATDDYSEEDDILLRQDFDDLIKDIKQTYISKNYVGLMAWLINRALILTQNLEANNQALDSNLKKNRSVLMKVLYKVNPYQFLQCFKTKQN